MAKYYRGDVVYIKYPFKDKDGNLCIKPRPVVILQNQSKNFDVITVYCTSKNDGDDKNCLIVERGSEVASKMGLEETTYIRPNKIKNFPIDMIIRLIGKCPLMHEISKILEENRAK